MKKRRICSTLLLSILLFIVLPPAVKGGTEVSLQNPGFESWRTASAPIGGWTVTKGSGSVSVEKEDCTEGSLSLCLTSAASQTSEMAVRQIVEGLTGGMLYEFSADFKMPSALSPGFGMIPAVYSGNTCIVKPDAPVSHSDSSWRRIAVLFTAPADGTVTVCLSYLPEGNGAADILFDNATLKAAEKGKMELYLDPSVYVLPGAVTPEAEAGRSCYYSGAVVISGAVPKAGEQVLCRVSQSEETAQSIIGNYTQDSSELTELHVLPQTGEPFSAVLAENTGLKGFSWKRGTLIPLKKGTDILPPSAEKPLIKSGDFESYVGSTAYGWSAYGGWKSGYAGLFADENGGHSMRVAETGGGVDPYVYQSVPLSPETKYRLTLSVKQENIVGNGAGIKLEFTDRDGQGAGAQTEYLTVGKSGFENTSIEFETTAATTSVFLLLRLYGTGSVYFDNVHLTQLSFPPAGSVETDEFFYYPEWKTGTATVRANTVAFPLSENGTCDVFLKDGKTVLEGKRGLSFSEGSAEWVFGTEKLKTEGKAYTVEAVIYDEAGGRLGTCETLVYMYNRPACLDENGNYRNEDGTLFVPRIGYHLSDMHFTDEETAREQLSYAKAAGINVVQLSTGLIYYPDYAKETLDLLQSLGMKGLVALYDKGYAAGSAHHALRTKLLVQAVKNHPAVFAYAVYDEPSIGAKGLTEEDLINSYRIIRDIDKKHPTYTVIAPGRGGNADIARSALTKYTDVICYDPYPATWDDAPASYVYEVHSAAAEAVKHQRPVYTLMQVFDWRGFFPSADEYRHMWYQAAMGGSKGIGIFSLNDAVDFETDSRKGLWTSAIWDSITGFAEEELAEAEKHFMHSEYPLFSEGETGDYRYRAWEKNGDVYMVILRLDSHKVSSPETAPAVRTEIPLLRADGTKQIGAFSAECIYGGGTDDAVVGNGTLSVSLGHRQALVYKITAR